MTSSDPEADAASVNEGVTAQPIRCNTLEFIERESARILSACTQCGACFEACPMTSYIQIDDMPRSVDVVAGILSVLRGDRGTAAALAWSRVCMMSGECVPSCHDSVNPMLMVRLARMVASGGTGGEPQFWMADDLAHFPRVRAFAEMQLSKAEFDEWLS